jgi:DNA-binding LytR/AlgR family response regulator
VLDVYIGDEMGTALARYIRKLGIESPIIFATTSVEHAPQSYEMGTLRYLIKPINPAKFYEAMDVAIASAEKLGERLIKLKTENGVESINASHIMFSEAHDHYQYVKLLDGTQIKVRSTVTELFAILSKHGGFIRLGSAYIINLRHVKNLSRTDILLYNNIAIPIPRGKYNEIKNAFWDYQYAGQED